MKLRLATVTTVVGETTIVATTKMLVYDVQEMYPVRKLFATTSCLLTLELDSFGIISQQ